MAIADEWDKPERAKILLEQASPQGQRALCRLAKLDAVPASLFFAEYGHIRRARKDAYYVAPWKEPQNAAEELYYLGLLHTVDGQSIDKSYSLCLPDDLRTIVREVLCPTAAPPASTSQTTDEVPLTAWSLCHDVGQLLLLPVQQDPYTHTLSLQHGRWLDRRTLNQLCQHLAIGEDPVAASHRQSYRPRLLMFLAEAANLLRDGAVTTLGEAWLGEPFPEQLLWLWRAWSEADGDLRARFHLADALLPRPWPAPFLQAIAAMADGFSIIDLLAAVLDGSGRDAGHYGDYWGTQFKSLGDLEALLASVLHDVAALFGAVVVMPGAAATVPEAYELTSIGAWLFDRPGARAPVPPPQSHQAVIQKSRDGYQIQCPATVCIQVLYKLGRFARQHAATGAGVDLCHYYAITPQSVAQAAQAGYRMPEILESLDAADLALDAEQQQRLSAWQSAVEEVKLAYRPVLEARSPEILAGLMQHDDVYTLIDQIVGPNTALLNCDLTEMGRALHASGLQSWQTVDGDGKKQGSESFATSLWLAAQIYDLLSDYLALPSGLPKANLDAITVGLSVAEMALLESQWVMLREQVLRLLDGETYAPPSFEADERRWLVLIDEAMAKKRLLSARHFSVGRNLLSEHVIKPYWIEEHRGYAYLRAERVQDGYVRLFRLDRIVSLSFYSPSTTKD